MYHAQVGRFASRDPIVVEDAGVDRRSSGTPVVRNPYAYVKNRPTGLLDPSGLVECPVTYKGTRIGTLVASKVFYHRDRGPVLPSNKGATGFGFVVDFVANKRGAWGPPKRCLCQDYRFIQVWGNRRFDPPIMVDVAKGATQPWYTDQSPTGATHTPLPGYPGEEKEKTTTVSMYDRPTLVSGFSEDPDYGTFWHGIYWPCIVCVRSQGPDIVLDCVQYAWHRRRKSDSEPWGDATAIGPSCWGKPTQGWKDALTHNQTRDGASLRYRENSEFVAEDR